MLKTIADYELLALQKLEPSVRTYIQATSGSGQTHAANLAAYSRYSVVPRVLENIEQLSTNVTILGKKYSSPFMIAPTAWHTMFCAAGESATLEATREVGVPYIISSFSSLSFEEMEGSLNHAWYQTLLYRDKNLHKKYISMAEKAGCSAIVITVDALLGCSMCKAEENQSGAKKAIFPTRSPLLPSSPELPYGSLDEYYDLYLNPAQSWKDIEEIVKYTKLPVVLKGILHPSDVEQATRIGVKAIIVSNHGGRQLDDAISTLEALEKISAIADNKIEIYLDGGIRSGVDAFKAIALGAQAVLIGRPALYGLAVDGKSGLRTVLEILSNELQRCMYMTGCKDIRHIVPDRLSLRK